MAKYDVAYRCGHTIVENLIGPHTDRERRIAAAKHRLCRDCYRAEQYRQAVEATRDLPALEGTPKQVEWATRLRAQTLADADDYLAEFAERASRVPADRQADVELVMGALQQARAELADQIAAAVWIDRRDDSGGDQIRQRARELVDLARAGGVVPPAVPDPLPATITLPDGQILAGDDYRRLHDRLTGDYRGASHAWTAERLRRELAEATTWRLRAERELDYAREHNQRLLRDRPQSVASCEQRLDEAEQRVRYLAATAVLRQIPPAPGR